MVKQSFILNRDASHCRVSVTLTVTVKYWLYRSSLVMCDRSKSGSGGADGGGAPAAGVSARGPEPL